MATSRGEGDSLLYREGGVTRSAFTLFRGRGNVTPMVCHLLGILSVVVGLTLYMVIYRLIK
jgi:hypothetical protein